VSKVWITLYLPPILVIAAALALFQERPADGAAQGFRLGDPRFDAEAGYKMASDLVALGPRSEQGPRRKAVDRILADARAWGAAKVEEQAFVDSRGREAWNVVAEYPGEGERAAERVMIVGHFDTVPVSPGALDNAASIGALAGLGRALAGRKLPRTVVLAAVDLEESGCCGSDELIAREAKAGRLDLVRVGISTEMLGALGGTPVLHTFPRGFRRPEAERPPGGGLAPRWLAATALAVGRDNGRPIDFGDPLMTPVYHIVFRHFMTPFDSDSGRFAERGIPALFLCDCSLARFYPHYHQPSDGIDQLDRASFAAAGRSLEAFVHALARRPALPWTSDGAAEAETDYLTLRAWVLPGWSIMLALALAPLPFLARALARRGALVLLLGVVPAAATVGMVLAAPVTAFVVLFPAWLAAPAVLCSSRIARGIGAIAVLAPAAVTAAIMIGAMRYFRHVVTPLHAGWALAAVPAIAVAVALFALARPPKR
jgi:hypothetical protein